MGTLNDFSTKFLYIFQKLSKLDFLDISTNIGLLKNNFKSFVLKIRLILQKDSVAARFRGILPNFLAKPKKIPLKIKGIFY